MGKGKQKLVCCKGKLHDKHKNLLSLFNSFLFNHPGNCDVTASLMEFIGKGSRTLVCGFNLHVEKKLAATFFTVEISWS